MYVCVYIYMYIYINTYKKRLGWLSAATVMEMKCKLIILSLDGRKFGCKLYGGESFIWE